MSGQERAYSGRRQAARGANGGPGKRSRPRGRRSAEDPSRDRRTALPGALRQELKDVAAQADAHAGYEDEGAERHGARAPAKQSRKEARKSARREKKAASVRARTAWTERRKGLVSEEHGKNAKYAGGGKRKAVDGGHDVSSESGGEDVEVPTKKKRKGGNGRETGSSKNAHKLPEKGLVKGVDSDGKLPVDDVDTREARRLEKLLGISRKKKRRRAAGKEYDYGELFADDDDMAGLLQFIDKRQHASKGKGGCKVDGESPPQVPSGGRADASDDFDEDVHSGLDEPEVFDSESEMDDGGSPNLDEPLGEGLTGGVEVGAPIDDDVDASERSTSEGEEVGSESSAEVKIDEHESPVLDDRDEGNISSDEENLVDTSGRRDGGVMASKGKYVPPSVRAARGGTDRAPAVLRRVRGLLNRLSDSNSKGIANDVVGVFKSGSTVVSRVELACGYADAVLDAVRGGSGRGITNPFISSHAAIVANLGAVVEDSISAQLVVTLVRAISHSLQSTDTQEVFGYVSLFGALFEHQVIGCGMTYELIRLLSDDLSERNVELLLLLLRNVGVKLRVEDPVSLKDVIIHVRERAKEIPSTGEGEQGQVSRVDVMLDLIYEIKDNKLKRKELQADLARFGWVQHSGVRFEASFSDICDDEFVLGRWWEHDHLNQRLGKGDPETPTRRPLSREDVPTEAGSLVALAAAHRLNSEFRRQAFAAIMGSSDADDAMDRLDRLAAFEKKGGHDRDTIRVLLHCCSAERVFNPFYGQIASRICGRSRTLRFALEFALWEVVRESIGGDESTTTKGSLRKARNFGKLLGALLRSSSLKLFALRSGPDIDECSAGCLLMYRTALGSLFDRNEKGNANVSVYREAVELLCSERGESAASFRTSLAVFLRKELLPSAEEEIKPAVRQSIRSLEAA